MDKCRICNGELTYLEDRKCLRCLRCHPDTPSVPALEPEKPKILNEKITEEKVRDIVIMEINRRVKPPLSRDAIRQIVSEVLASSGATVAAEDVLTWRQRAKKMGIPLHRESGGMRKKEEVLADMEKVTASKETVSNGGD